MPSAQNQIQIVDTHETSETLAVTRLQRVGYQINRTLLIQLVNEKGHPLPWEDNLRVLATWVDAQTWQHAVANAVSAAAH